MPVRPNVTKCTSMHREQTAGTIYPILAKFKFMDVDKVAYTLATNFYQNRQRSWPSYSRSKIQPEYIEKFIRDYLENDDRYDKHCYCQQRKSHVAFQLAHLHLTSAFSGSF